MGRAPLGNNGRTVQAGLKVTPDEERALRQEFGSPGKGLRAALDAFLGAVGPPRSPGTVGPSMPAQEVPPTPVDEVVVAAARSAAPKGTAHVHDHFQVLSYRGKVGARTYTFRCTCGEDWEGP